LPLVYAALTSIKILKTDLSLRSRLNANTERIKSTLRSAGWPLAENASPIVAIVPESGSHAQTLRRRLLRARVFPSLIRYGHIPAPGYFRFPISSEHTRAQLDALANALDVPPS
jgi:7-keto-8-aminopelargonate synthetase-like enzyme